MILFVADQVAGAEYIQAIISQIHSSRDFEWEIIASRISSNLFCKIGIPHRVFDNISLEQARELVQEIEPSKGLISTSIHSALENTFVTALKEQNIFCIQFIDVWINYKKRFETVKESGERNWLFPDEIFTLDETARSQMIAEGIPAQIINIVGQPYFELRMRSYARRQADTTSVSGRILLVTQPISRFYGETLGYDEFTFMACCLEGARAAKINWNDLDVVVHPAEETAPYVKIFKSYSSLIRVVPNSELVVSDYGRMLGMFSSLLVQGLLAGIKICSVQPNPVGTDMCFLPQIPRLHCPEDVCCWLREEQGPNRRNIKSSFDLGALEGSCERIIRILKA